MSDFNTKKKFYENKDIMFDYNIINNKNINTENQLRTQKVLYKKKKSKNKRLTSYGNFTPGRGFGNLDANNIIRTGIDSRTDKKEYSTKMESNLNNRFDFLFDDKKQQVHTNVNFNMGGESTRSQQLNSDCIFKYKKTDLLKEQNELKEHKENDGFGFKY